MARRPNVGSREKLSDTELAELRQQLAAMTPRELEIYYRASLNACRYEAVPCPRVMQELVTAWRVLRSGGD